MEPLGKPSVAQVENFSLLRVMRIARIARRFARS